MTKTRRKFSLAAVCAVLSAFTLAAFHIPFFTYVVNNVESGFNAVMIVAGLAVLMLAANFFLYYLLLYPGRLAGRILVAATLVGDAISLYFINTYDVYIDATMMGNVFNTQFSEASGFFSPAAVLYVLLLGILPCILLFLVRIEYGSFRRFLASIGISLGVVVLIAFANMSNWPWIDRNATQIGSLLMPWSYTVNAVRYQCAVHERNREEILLPDAEFIDDEKDVVVLVIGESARRDHFSLYGYPRETNPLLSRAGVHALPAESAATYTTAGVKAIIDHKPTDKLYEILPNYLYRAGADVVWRTSNWGEPPLHIEKYMQVSDLQKQFTDVDPQYDGILLQGLREQILGSESNKVLVVIHTSTSHGPSYNKRYPAEFEVFAPVCNTVEMSKADHDELMNSYDNSIIYTDWLVNSVIEELKGLEGWRSCMLFISDHGESLGEGGLYMHGVPYSIAPREQLEIPYIVWTSDKDLKIKEQDKYLQYSVFHTVMYFLGARSEVYDESMNIFE